MANSKSNIYPIQLQGAELCLNRYDAEIKQYRGFNKNNSPFVGGCLSNVFTKEEQISGGNADNTYIDTNGDVYRVDTEGFYKNDEKLKELAAPFVNIKKLPTLNVPHRYFSERDVATVINKKMYLNGTFIVDMDDSQTDDELLNKFITGVYVKYDGDVYFIFTCKGYQYFRYLVLNEEGEIVCNYTSSEQYDFKNADTAIANVIMFDDTTGKVVVYYTRYDYDGTISFTRYYAYKSASFLTEGTIIYSERTGSTLLETNKTSSDQCATSNSVPQFIFIGYPFNLITVYGVDVMSDSKTYYHTFNFDFSTVTDNSHLATLNYTDAKHFENRSANGGGNGIYSRYDFDITPLFSGLVVSKGEGTMVFANPHGAFFPVVNNNVVTFSAMYIDIFDNFVLFLNNGKLSNIAVRYEDCNTIMIANWNTINPFSLCFCPDKDTDYHSLCFNDNGDFYCITLDEIPKLKLFGDQIVLNNITSNYNSYFYKRNYNKWGLFAPGFNTSLKINNTSSIANCAGSCNTSNTSRIATAVNEYSLENNPSIILNPITYCLPYIWGSTTTMNVALFLSPSLGYSGINLYNGDDTNVKYLQTIIFGGGRRVRYNPDLKGLLFPSQTDGNVMYSLSLFSVVKNIFGNQFFLKSGSTFYPLAIGNNNKEIMAYYLAAGVDNVEDGFILQGQFYGIINNGIYSILYNNGVIVGITFIVDISNLQFVGNTPYEALFFSKTNRCLYSFTGANVLNQKQLVDKISEVRNYLYNPATQTVFLITDIGVLFYGLFGMFLLEYTDITNIFLLDNGIVMSDNSGNYRYIKYYLDEDDTDYTKENIRLETCFYGMNNEVVTINDCLYFRLFSEEHEEGNLKVSATTISLKGRQTEETTFKIKASDWDKITHTIYLRYQPKTQRGLGVSFSIDSPFKIASMSVGSQPDAVLVDKVSKGAITAPSVTTNNNEW